MDDEFADVATQIGRAVGTDDSLFTRLTMTGPRSILPSCFDVTGLATGAVAVATLTVAQHLAARRQSEPLHVTVNSREACAAFMAEGLFSPIGWTLPPLWDPIAGNYRTADAWIRLHTNYAHHRAVVEQVLGVNDRAGLLTAVAKWPATDLESVIVARGGCAAVMRDRLGWLTSAQGAATAEAPPVTTVERAYNAGRSSRAVQPLDGVRVLDLTRVIAGPVCTRVLAGYGADVLRIDPPGFAEVPSLLPETTVGKRTASLDLSVRAEREVFECLLADADVLVSGLRPDALTRLGYDDQALTALNPGLIIASLDAYGWDGPWHDRRGFDSLVQMSCGIAAAPGRSEPTALPVQALDHATGWLLAAAVARALTRRITESTTSRIRASLIGTANLLYAMPRPVERLANTPTADDFDLIKSSTAWGPARRVPAPGQIAGRRAHFSHEAGPLGRHTAAWLERNI